MMIRFILALALFAIISIQPVILIDDVLVEGLIYDDGVGELFVVCGQSPYRVEIYDAATMDYLEAINAPTGTWMGEPRLIQIQGCKIAIACQEIPYPERFFQPQDATILLIDPLDHSTEIVSFNYNNFACFQALYNPVVDCIYCELVRVEEESYMRHTEIVKYDLQSQQVTASVQTFGSNNLAFNTASNNLYNANWRPVDVLYEIDPGVFVESASEYTGILGVHYDAGDRFQTSGISLEAPCQYVIASPVHPIDYAFCYKHEISVEDETVIETTVMYFYTIEGNNPTLRFTEPDFYVSDAAFYDDKLYCVMRCHDKQPWDSYYSNDVLVVDLISYEYSFMSDVAPTGIYRIAAGNDKLFIAEEDGYRVHAVDII